MKLRPKPKKPVNSLVSRRMNVCFETIGSIYDKLVELGINPYVAKVEYELSYSPCECDEHFVEYKSPRWTEEEFKDELSRYEKRLDTYNKWYEANKDEIEAELAKRKKEKVEKEKKRAEIEKIKKEKEIAKLQKQLSKLKDDKR